MLLRWAHEVISVVWSGVIFKQPSFESKSKYKRSLLTINVWIHCKAHTHTREGKWHVKLQSDECVSRQKGKQLRRLPPPWGWKARKAWTGSGWECSEILFQQPEGAVAPGSCGGPSVKACSGRGGGGHVNCKCKCRGRHEQRWKGEDDSQPLFPDYTEREVVSLAFQ